MKEKLLALLCTLVLLAGLCPANFAVAEDAPQYLTKTSDWTGNPTTDKDKKNLDIILEAQNIDKTVNGKILFLGSLCNAHSLNNTTVRDSLTTAAKYADVELHLWQVSNTLSVDNTVDGTLKKGYNLNATNDSKTDTTLKNKLEKSALESGKHSILYKIAEVLASDSFDPDDYAMIVLEVDGMSMGHITGGTVSTKDKENLNKAAAVLKNLYANNKVVWILAPTDTKISDNNEYNGYSTYIFDDPYFDNAYGSDAITQTTVRETVKIFAPEDLKDGAVTGSLTAQKTLIARMTATGTDKIWVDYKNNEDVQNFLEEKFMADIYQKVVIKDTVEDEFTIKKVTGQYATTNAAGAKVWNNITSQTESATTPGFKYETSGQTVTGTFLVKTIENTNVRLVINCDVNTANGDPFVKDGVEKEGSTYKLPTNVGKAQLEYYKKASDLTPEVTSEANPAKIGKNYYDVTTSVTNGTITPSKTKVAGGTDVTIEYSPDENYVLDSIKIDGEDADTTGITSSKKFEKIGADHTIDVVYKLKQYTVDFDLASVPVTTETTPEDQKVNHGATTEEPANDPVPTDTDISFAGWYDSDEYETEFNFETPTTKDTTVYGKFTAPVIIHDPTGPNTTSANETVTVGDTATKPSPDPLCTGYTFGGYFTDEACTEGNEFDFETPITDKTDIYVKWTEKTADPTYDKNTTDTTTDYLKGDKIKDAKTVPEDKTVYTLWAKKNKPLTYHENADGETVTGMPSPNPETMYYTKQHNVSKAKPERYGYTFKGWATTEELADAGTVEYARKALYKKENDVPVKGDLYAVWKEIKAPLHYDPNTDDPTVANMPKDQKMTYTRALNLRKKVPTRLGYTFKGWAATPEGEVKYSPEDHYKDPNVIPVEATFYAVWEENTATFTYYSNEDGNFGYDEDGNGIKGFSETIGVVTGTPTGSKGEPFESYNFFNWTDAEGETAGTDPTFLPEKNGQGIYEDGTYTANFAIKKYDVKFDLMDHGNNDDGYYDDQVVNHDSKAVEPTPDPSEEGYKFIDWYEEPECENVYDFETSITASKTLYARWETVVTFFEPTGPDTDEESEDILVGDTTDKRNPSCKGYDFGGFFTDKEFTEPFDFDAPVTEPTTVYAKWIEHTGTIVYNLNGGTSQDNLTQGMRYTEKAEVRTLVPVREGHTFKGWATSKANADAGKVEYTGKQQYKAEKEEPINAVLYAVWEKKVVPFTGDIMNTSYTVVVMALALFTGVLIYKKRIEDEEM